MNLRQKIAAKMRDPIPEIQVADCHKWARFPRSQKAVDLMFTDPPMTAEIEFARKNGYIDGDRWVPPEKRKPANRGEE